MTRFHMRNSERTDTGSYKIHAENINGVDDATVQVGGALGSPRFPTICATACR